MNYSKSIVVDKNNLSIKLDGVMSTREILGSLDEIVDAAIAAPSNYTKPLSNRKQILAITLLDLITTKDIVR